jgi:hypothetical protein
VEFLEAGRDGRQLRTDLCWLLVAALAAPWLLWLRRKIGNEGFTDNGG